MNDDCDGYDDQWPDAPDINNWHSNGVKMGATHMILTYDGCDDYQAVYVMPDGDSLERMIHLCEGGGHVHEVIDLSRQLDEQQIYNFIKHLPAA